MKKILLSTILCLCAIITISAQKRVVSLNSDVANWTLQPEQELLPRWGKDVSKVGFRMSDPVKAVVPGTVFTSYVLAGREKDPNYGTNILDADESYYNRPFWYRTEFVVTHAANQHVWLCFDNTNRYADFWLNGHKLSGTDSSSRDVSGHMLRSKFDITPFLNKKGRNALAVLVYDADQKKSRHDESDFANMCSPSYLSAAGWDWMPYVPGRLAGITGGVRLEIVGDVTLQDPWVRADLPTYTHADLSISTTIHSNSATGHAVVKGTILPDNISFSKLVDIGGSDTKVIIDSDDCPQLSFDNPRLWWPNGYGDQNLYKCNLSVEVNGVLSDCKEVVFGIKRYEYAYINNKVQQPVLTFFINGRRLFLKGGSWGMAEYMLRCDSAEYDKKIRLHKDMNYNMIRCWTGCVTDEAFYEACDKYGIMVWDDFWLHSGEGVPEDFDAFKTNALDKVRRIRNHPSVALWCGANESRPVKELDDYLRKIVAEEDHGDRLYKASSNQDGLSGSSPWTNRPPRFHFETSMGGLVLLNPPYPYGIDYGYGCRSEIGMATMPNYESVKLFIPEDEQWPLPADSILSEFNDNVWNHHFYGARGGNAGPIYYRDCIYDRYGEPHSLQEFCDKAQFVNYEDMKGIYEGWNDKMGNDASGVLIWMSMSAFPSCVWQTFDYYYDTTGAYYAAKKACEPWHIQWNVVTNAVKVVNTSNQDMNHVKAIAHVYDFNGNELTNLRKEKTLSLRAADVAEAFRLEFERNNVALGCKAVASSVFGDKNVAQNVTDGLMSSRWESEFSDPQWIMVDLGQQRNIATIRILWEGAFSQTYDIQLSDDAENWHTAYSNHGNRGGTEIIDIAAEMARYLRVKGLSRNTWFGHSIYEIEVYEPSEKTEIPLQFIRLELRDENDKLIADNFYWRNSDIELDYKQLANLPEANITAKLVSQNMENGITNAVVEIENHSNSVAFGNRLRLVDPSSGERILPVTMTDNYFTLMPHECKLVTIEYPDARMHSKFALLLKQYLFIEKEILSY